MKKKLLLLSALLSFSTLAFSQTTARSDINTAFSSWLIPIMAVLFIVGTGIVIFHNMDALRGKSGTDQKEAWFNLFLHVVYVAIGISILYYVVSKVTAISFTV